MLPIERKKEIRDLFFDCVKTAFEKGYEEGRNTGIAYRGFK